MERKIVTSDGKSSVGEILDVGSIPEIVEIAKSFSSSVSAEYSGYAKEEFGIWFRGQSGLDFPLPPIMRGDEFDETSIHCHFKLRLPEFRNSHRTEFDWLCLMQHYGAPTRLLDWSESLLVALHFAVSDESRHEEDGVIFLLSARSLNQMTDISPSKDSSRPMVHTPEGINTTLRALFANYRAIERLLANAEATTRSSHSDNFESLEILEMINVLRMNIVDRSLTEADKTLLEKIRMPTAVLPSRLNPRIIAQQGAFTLHGGVSNDQHWENTVEGKLPAIDLPFNSPTKQPIVKTIRIPKRVKKRILKDLIVMGVHEGSLFPEIDNQAAYLKDLWRPPSRDS